jgi:DUF438 domain-containing protein
MTRTVKKCLAEELEGLLLRIHDGKPTSDLRKQANRLISAVTPQDIAKVEDRLVKGGLSARRVQQLSAAFILMGLMDSNKTNLRERLNERHVLKKVLAEHDMLQCFIFDLEDVVLKISQESFLSDTSGEIRRLEHIAEHVNAMEEHIDRENDVIFPALRSQGWDSLCRSVENDHVHIRAEINELVRLVDSFVDIPFGVFKGKLMTVVKTLCPILKEHLFYEDHILYPVAVAMIDNQTFWDKMHHYCGIHV